MSSFERMHGQDYIFTYHHACTDETLQLTYFLV